MILYLDEKHTLRVEGDKHIGYVTENKVESLDIIVESEKLLAKEPYIEFQLNNGRKFTTDQLKYDGNHLIYEIPNTLLYENGFLKVQVVLKEPNEITWKSSVVSLVVDESILGNEHVLDSIDEMSRKLNEIVTDSKIDTFVFENLEELRNAISYVYNDKTQLYELLSITYEGQEIKVENIKLGVDVFTKTENESDYWLSSFTSTEDNPLSFFTEQSAKTMIDITYEEFEELEPQENTFYRIRLDPDVTFFLETWTTEVSSRNHSILYQHLNSWAYFINPLLKKCGLPGTCELKFVDKLPDNPHIMTFETRNNIIAYFNMTDGQLYLFIEDTIITGLITLNLAMILLAEGQELSKEEYNGYVYLMASFASYVDFKGNCKNQEDIYKLFNEVFPKNKEEIKHDFMNEYHIILDNYLLGYYKNGEWHWLEKTLNFLNTGEHFSYEETETTTFSTFTDELPWTITGKFGNIIRKVNANVLTYETHLEIEGNEHHNIIVTKPYTYVSHQLGENIEIDCFDTLDSVTLAAFEEYGEDSESKSYVIDALVDEKVSQESLYNLKIDITNKLNNKVDQVTGKGLSTNDFTNELKEKLERIEENPTITVDNELSTTSTNPVQNKVITEKTNNLERSLVLMLESLESLSGLGYKLTLNDTDKIYITPDDKLALTNHYESTTVIYNNEYYVFDYKDGNNIFFKKIDQFGFTYIKIDITIDPPNKCFEIIEQPLAKPIDREGTTHYIEALEYDNEHFSLPGTKVINTTNKTTLTVEEMNFLYEYHLTENSNKEYHGERVVLVDNGKIYYNVVESTEITTTFTFITFDNNSNMSYITITKQANNTGIITRLSNDILTKAELDSMKGANNGIAPLDNNGKILLEDLPDVILGQLVYGGTVAYETSPTSGVYATLSTNGQTKLNTTQNKISLINAETGNYGYKTCEGLYFIASTNLSLGDYTYLVGDWLVATASGWKKVQNTDAVVSVNGKIGTVQVTKNDVGLGNVDNTSDANKPVSTAQASAIKAVQDTVDEQLSTINTALGNKVDKVSGKQLSTEDFTTELKNKVERETGFITVIIEIDYDNKTFTIPKSEYSEVNFDHILEYRLADVEASFYSVSNNVDYDKFYSIDNENKLTILTITTLPTETTDGNGTISCIDLSDVDETKMYSVPISVDYENDTWSMTAENWSKYKEIMNSQKPVVLIADNSNYFYKQQVDDDNTLAFYIAYNNYYNLLMVLLFDNDWDPSSFTQSGEVKYIPLGEQFIDCSRRMNSTNDGGTIEIADLKTYEIFEFYWNKSITGNNLRSSIVFMENDTQTVCRSIDFIDHVWRGYDLRDNCYIEIEATSTDNITWKKIPANYEQMTSDIESLKASKLEIKESVTTPPTKVAEYFSDGTNTYATHYTVTMKPIEFEYGVEYPLTDFFTDEDIAILKAHPESCRIFNGDLENFICIGIDDFKFWHYYTQSFEEPNAYYTIYINFSKNTIRLYYNAYNEIIPIVTSFYNGLMTSSDKIKLDKLSEPTTVVIDTVPTATNGTLTEEQLATLQENEENKIMFNHEKYYLMDVGHTEGFLTYTHIGIENGVFYIKAFTITVSTKSWVLNIKELS